MTRDDVLHIMRALGFRPPPDFDPPPFHPRCVVTELRCTCGRTFGLDVDRLTEHTRTDHGREATRDERTPR